MLQDQEGDEQTGGSTPNEEEKEEETKSNGEKEADPKASYIAQRAEEIKKARERLAKRKRDIATKTKGADEETKKEESKGDDDIQVTTDFVASGSRDKRIKIWECKRGN
mmetsp:Transcript_28889/g.32978  ORF Transcript_28889/g.32978 Transcript_28889/m.32978 type:complete len:109 (-) Transcript_28889:291-617(-)